MFSVDFYPCDNPCFVFESRLVPAEHLITYSYETPIFVYLNSHLLPSDISSVRIESDGLNGKVVITYILDDETILNLPPFEPCFSDDCSF